MLSKQRAVLYLTLFTLLDLTFGLFVPPNAKKPQEIKEDRAISDSQWSIYKTKLGLTDQKVQMLKSQSDQEATAKLIKQFMQQNPKYVSGPAENAADTDKFHDVYQGLIKQLQAAKGSLKASLNFELADKSATQKPLKRSRRKIAFKMVSDIPSEKIDDLLAMFSEQHGLNNQDAEDELSNEESTDYNEIAVPVSTSAETEYEYENLWEDGDDPHALNTGPQYGSFQDLIMRASQQRHQRGMEE